jgi:HEAT repeat protein
MAEPNRRTVTQDDSLPPVEPPSAAFLVQLFLVPAIIVAIIVFVWLAFHWLAQLGNDPEGYVKTLRRNNEGRWQAALNLANDLRGPGGERLKGDAALAGDLGDILADEIASGRPAGGGFAGEQAQTLCVYLCRALGEFAVPEAAGPLVAAAKPGPDMQTPRAAVEALSVLASNLAAAGREFAEPEAVVAAVGDAAASDDGPLRSAAAFTLGVLGGDASRGRLGQLLADASPDVRANAALGLARQGRADAAVFGVLEEMLGGADVEAAPGDEAAQARRYKRALVVVNALKGVGMLVDATREAPPANIVALVTGLASDPIPDVRTSATALLGKIERVASAPKAP